MDLGPWIVLAIFIALIAFSMASRTRSGGDGSSDLKPPSEPGDAGNYEGRLDV